MAMQAKEEALGVEAMIASWQHLQVDLRTRLRAQYRLQAQQGISLASFISRFSILIADGRMQLALALSSLATVDGNIAEQFTNYPISSIRKWAKNEVEYGTKQVEEFREREAEGGF
jgi:hypothetical protein